MFRIFKSRLRQTSGTIVPARSGNTMVFGAAYMKNFGAASDDPKMAVSWENHFQTLKASAEVEEARKKFTMAGWSSKQPANQATPPRT